jgi:hypothetical protein
MNYHFHEARHILWNIPTSFSLFLAEDKFYFICNLCLHVLSIHNTRHYLRAINSGLPPHRNYADRVANVRLIVAQMRVCWPLTVSSGWRVVPAGAV